MPARIHKERPPAQKREEPQPTPAVSKAEEAKKLDAEMDSILEDIDSVLEENAAEFVAGYQQKGGE